MDIHEILRSMNVRHVKNVHLSRIVRKRKGIARFTLIQSMKILKHNKMRN